MGPVSASDSVKSLAIARRWLNEATSVVIGAGAGLSAAAGIDYTDTGTFQRLFPALARKGFRAQYQLIGFGAWSAEEEWAYWATHVAHVRFGVDERAVYQALRRLLQGKDTFVLTSNVDALFVRNGFDERRIFTPQGDYARMQCRKPCTLSTWDTEPIVRRLQEHIDAETLRVTEPRSLPVCPHCGGAVFMNVRLDRGFVEAPYFEQRQRFVRWLSQRQREPLLLLEIGAGFNTPGVVRYQMEQLAAAWHFARLVRINPRHAEVPRALSEVAIGLHLGAAETLAELEKGGG